MKFITKSGSTYEVDIQNNRIRRTCNISNHKASEFQGDNTWVKYAVISEIMIGEPLLIVWDKSDSHINNTNNSRQYSNPSTLTSPVLHIIEDVPNTNLTNISSN